MSRVDYEYSFDPDADNNTAASVYRLAAAGGHRVLDLGSGPGIVSSHLQQAAGKDVTCLDNDPELLSVAEERGVGETIVADLDGGEWLERLSGREFDVIILADVLEHLVDPGGTLHTIRSSGLLADDGFLVVSIPNASHEGALAELISGNLTYRPTGLLDETHIRFFTLASFRRLVEASGFIATHVVRTLRTTEQTEFKSRLSSIPSELRRLLHEHSPESGVYQYVLRLVQTTEAGVWSAKVQEIDDLTERLSAQNEEIEQLRQATDQRIESLQGELAHLRGIKEELRAEIAELKARAKEGDVENQKQLRQLREGQVRRLLELDEARLGVEGRLKHERSERKHFEREVRKLERRIEQIYASKTWLIGDRVRRSVALFLPKRKALHPDAPRTRAELSHSDPDPVEPLANSPLAGEYTLELDRGLLAGTEGVGFTVSTRDFGEGRGDLFVATGLGRKLRNKGWSSVYLPPGLWYDFPDDLDSIIVMLPSFRPSRAAPGPRIIGWVRNEVDNWLTHPELGLFDAILCSSPLVAAEIERHYGGPIGVLPIGVDLDLFDSSGPNSRSGVVSTVNQWGRERDVYRALRSTKIDFPLSIYGRSIGLPDQLKPFQKGSVGFFALPEIYRGAEVVLDDFNHTTVGWGAVNSRVFESLASGALPITNSSLGLSVLGLEEVPTYNDPKELNSMVEGFLSNPETTRELTARLSAVVRSRHSYEKRASDLLLFLEGIDEPAQRVLSFFPDYRENNPYQDMLYSEGRKYSSTVFPLTGLDMLTTSLARFQKAEQVFHLHWTAPIIGRSSTEAEALSRVDDMLKKLDDFQSGGGRFVWTVHNVLPHESRYRNIEVHLRSELARRADLIHVMCRETLEATGDLYTLPTEKTHVVAHSSYIGVYPDSVARSNAREKLGLASDDVVLLAFGGIRPYKGIDQLLDAFDRAVQTEPRLRLVVAGKPGRFEGIEGLHSQLDEHPRCIPVFSEIDAEDLQYFYKAADVAVLPHATVLNSGALLLAYTFGLPVIAPSVGCLKDLLSEDSALVFQHGEKGSLEKALASAPRLANHEARRAARSVAESLPVPKMSRDFFEVLAYSTSPSL